MLPFLTFFLVSTVCFFRSIVLKALLQALNALSEHIDMTVLQVRDFIFDTHLEVLIADHTDSELQHDRIHLALDHHGT